MPNTYFRLSFDRFYVVFEATVFQSVHPNLEFDPHSDECPVSVGSNQRIIPLDQLDCYHVPIDDLAEAIIDLCYA